MRPIHVVRWLALAMAAPGIAAGGPAPVPADRGVAVIELFTSEGCSSCPPADALLERFAADTQRSGRHVFALSFHVDYWDHLGWKDRYSSAAYSQRQRLYARQLGLSGLYTPQMVVNGARELVGSDRTAAETAVREALSSAAPATVRLTAVADGRDVTVEYAVAGAPAGAILEVAWVDARGESAPNRGENQGRALRHANVVRDLHDIVLKDPPAGSVRVTRPEIKDGAVIAWIQAAPAGRVLGAASVSVPAR